LGIGPENRQNLITKKKGRDGVAYACEDVKNYEREGLKAGVLREKRSMYLEKGGEKRYTIEEGGKQGRA